MTRDDAEHLRRAFAGWAEAEASVFGLAVVGSWARGTAHAGSDLDVLVLTDDRDRWAADDGWLRVLLARAGLAASSVRAEVHGAARTWRAWAGPSLEVEVTLAALAWADTAPVDPGTRRVVGDGMDVLVDRAGRLRAVQEAVGGIRRA